MAQVENIADVLRVTDNDAFNALMAVELHRDLGKDHVYRLSAADMRDRIPAAVKGRTLFGAGAHVLFAEHLTYDELTRRFERGARLIRAPAGDARTGSRTRRDGMQLLFAISAGGELRVMTAAGGSGSGDVLIWLSPGTGEREQRG